MTSLSQRLLHTSLPHRILAARSGVRCISTNPTQSELALQARNLIRETADENVAEPSRKFEANQVSNLLIQRYESLYMIYPPHEFHQSSLHPEGSPNPRQPLLGPPNKIAKQIDAFHLSSSDPLDHIFNPSMSRAFVNQMGRIKTRAETGLTWKNQRKVGKLVRRARAMGLISQWTDRSPVDEFR